MNELIIYRCEICGNTVCMINDSGVVPECCGEPMTEIVAGTVDASREKHVPVMKREGDCVRVKVGSEPHPMERSHYIKTVVLITDKGSYVRNLAPGDDPEVIFCLETGEKPEAVYEYCNLHGLWKG